MQIKKTSLFLFFALAGCSQTEFASLSPVENLPQEVREDFSLNTVYPLRLVEDFFRQDQTETSRTSIFFKVEDSDSNPVFGLQAQDFVVTENSEDVRVFRLGSNQISLGQRADIVFVVDHTASMGSTIEETKRRVGDFVANLRQRGSDVRLCLVSFRDRTTKKCEVFVEDNPATAQNENLESFLRDMNALRTGGGGGTLDEGQLKALMDAALSPWRGNSQRAAILLTDAGFLYSPNNQGAIGRDAPEYQSFLNVVRPSQMSIFAVTPSKAGYNSPFQRLPAMTSFNGGAWFNYAEMVAGRISLASILDQIAERIGVQYVVEYESSQNPNLNPNLPLSARRIAISLKVSSRNRVQIQQVSSNFPQGRPQGKSRFRLSREARTQTGERQVLLNQRPISQGFRLEKRELVFDQPPESNAEILVRYTPENLRDAFSIQTMILPKDLEVSSLSVKLNSQRVPLENLGLSRNSNGDFVFDPSSIVFKEGDPFELVRRRELRIEISGERIR
jgi:hypothetical protein